MAKMVFSIPRKLVIFLCGTLISVISVSHFFAGKVTKFEELIGGINSKRIMTNWNGLAVHCRATTLNNCLQTLQLQDDSKVKRGLIIGASQLHTISPYKTGQRVVSNFINDNIHGKDWIAITISEPNLNLQEALLIYLYITSHVNIDKLLLPVVIKNMNDDGIRAKLLPFLHDARVVNKLKITSTGREILARYSALPFQKLGMVAPTTFSTKDSMHKLHHGTEISGWSICNFIHHSYRDEIEKRLQQFVAHNFATWRAREEIRGHLILRMFAIRQFVLKEIDALLRWIRGTGLAKCSINFDFAIPESAYGVHQYIQLNDYLFRFNMDSLGLILRNVKQKCTKTYVYYQPRPIDVHFPYLPNDISKVRAEIASFAKNDNVIVVANLENIVPSSMWGWLEWHGTIYKDIFHFSEDGHRILAQRLSDMF